MKFYLTLVFALVLSTLTAQDLSDRPPIEAWETTLEDGSTMIAIVTEGFFSVAAYTDNEFRFTLGGISKVEGNKVSQVIEYHSAEPDQVGTKPELTFEVNEQGQLVGTDGLVWTRVDDGSPGDLKGAWLITGRMRNGEISRRTPGVRKTMKILSGTRFQWIAYNTETKEFMGTGGGTYTTEGGKYVENIDFFSRDNTRVGASLDFNFELKDGEWHHSGKSSKGNDIYEIWSLRE